MGVCESMWSPLTCIRGLTAFMTVDRRTFLSVGGVTCSCSASRFCREATNSVSVCRPDRLPVNVSVGSSDLSIPSRRIGGIDGSAGCVCVCVGVGMGV